MHPRIARLLADASAGVPLDLRGAEALLPLVKAGLLDVMAAARVAASRNGAAPFTCGIVNAKSGRCQDNCAFCPQSIHHHADAPVHALLPDDAFLRRAEALAARGAMYMGIVTSGTRPTPRDFERILGLGRRIGSSFPLRMCASLGLLQPDQAAALREAGFTSYHHNLETGASFYPAICTSHGYHERVATVRNARAAGLRVCCGGLFGLGESWTQRLELFALLGELDVDAIPVNFLNPIPGTALGSRPPPTPDEALAVIALLRLMHPARDIVVCGGRDIALGRFAPLLFTAGANGVMVGDYLTTKGSAADADAELLRVLGIA